ncbi:hypothetical protein ACOBQJ_03270 [Pelotomaculum propionicicum]|uniref:hypothetical protein n=1 Tax=Pelotomaculum propionicicum TaxID=258475 RepID=UPI003B79CA68
MRRFMRVLIVCMVLILSMLSVVSAEQQKEWITITTSVDASGNEVATQVFGYYLNADDTDQVFVVCDPSTGEETGDAYVPGFEVGKRDVIVGYNIKYGEDFNTVKKINPVTIKMAAPNVFTDVKYTDYSFDYREQTGELVQSTYGSATWPGTTKGFLIPGADPDYWLVVNEIRNPNGWPVKVKVKSGIRSFRSSFRGGGNGGSISNETEVYLEAYETKHILVNRGKPADCYFLADELEEGDAWSEGRLYTHVTENMDPELPERLKDSKGYIKFLYTVGSSQPRPIDLSGGFDTAFRLTCKDTKGNWYFDGRVKFTGNGWEATPSSDSRNTLNVKTTLENILNTSYSSGSLPYVDEKTLENGSFKIYESKNVGATLANGPETQIINAAGPALMDYSGAERGSTFDLNYEDTPTFSRDGIPALFYTPIFVEFYRFVPNENSTDVGRLVKEVKPGFAVAASTVKRPHISVNDQMQNYTVEKVEGKSNGKYYSYWKITLNHHVTLTAENPDSYGVQFTGVTMALPNIYDAVNKIESYLGHRYDADIDVNSPDYSDKDYDPTIARFDTIYLGPDQSSIIYDRDITTEILIDDEAVKEYSQDGEKRERDVTIKEEEIKKAIESTLEYINWQGEAAIRTGQIKFSSSNVTEQILTLNRSELIYRDDDRKKYYTKNVGLINTENRLLQPLSYFEDGVATRTTDELWIKLLASRHMGSHMRNDDGFWPEYDYSGKKGWRFEESLNERY